MWPSRVGQKSLSARRAWIEIIPDSLPWAAPIVALRKESVDRNIERISINIKSRASLSARRAWIEIPIGSNARIGYRSLSARRAWIEISPPIELHHERGVALRKESVDRNITTITICTVSKVALRKESVDRNFQVCIVARGLLVALRKESVDRNVFGFGAKLVHSVALRKESVDRNSSGAKADSVSKVALRKESVDRNSFNPQQWHLAQQSLSARRAWIEM